MVQNIHPCLYLPYTLDTFSQLYNKKIVLYQVGDQVEFVVVTNSRTKKHSACCVRKLG